MRAKPRCKFGNFDTCDGINGTSLFICNDCAESAEIAKEREEEAKFRGEGRPACEIIEQHQISTGSRAK
jgi:hypothetical protein